MTKKLIKNVGGRPPKYKTIKELEDRIDLYFISGMTFKEVNINNKIIQQPRPTMAGLTLFLGFCETSYLDFLGKDERFSQLIKKAKLYIQMYHEENLNNTACTGSIFWLKNWAAYKDKTEVDTTISIKDYRIEFGNTELLDEGTSKDNNA